jgi:uncharacterized protein (DUF1330 family)
MSNLEPTGQQLAALAARPPDTPVVMVNLVKFKSPGGLERYLQYGAGVIPYLQRAKASVVYAGQAPATVIGEGEQPWWDAIILVQYPTPQAFIDMVTSEGYPKVHDHRTAALERGDLVATSQWVSLQ